MENQHRKIDGYRDLSQEEIALINEIKAKGEELRRLIAKIRDVAIPPPPLEAIEVVADGVARESQVGEFTAVDREGDDPMYWLRYADGAFRTGVMYAVRAVAKPTTY
ncbi:DUF7681 family protein [Robbsia andropogonis]|uniref:Acb2/Tad1 domain-containing protein n=1 Tax=Robbsia andropogonis TaxID=28092 RepID=UPI003D1D00C1